MKQLRLLLLPLSFIYGAITSIRNLCYDWGLFRSTTFTLPVICVGNLSTGGTGKTPHIEYLIRLLEDSHILATLSRGYKRKTEGFLLANEQHTATDLGDEPLQFFRKFPKVYISVDAKRVNGIQQLQKQTDAEIILLDDAFQHRAATAGYYIMLSDFNKRFTKDFILPAGDLRESRKGATRADLIVITKCPPHLTTQEKKQIISEVRKYSNAPVVFSHIAYQEAVSMQTKTKHALDKNCHYLVVTGIANPAPLHNHLQKAGITFDQLRFPDHHDFTDQDIDKINRAFQSISAVNKKILTTEKDAMRLFDIASALIQKDQISYLPIQIDMDQADKDTFRSKILTFIKHFPKNM